MYYVEKSVAFSVSVYACMMMSSPSDRRPFTFYRCTCSSDVKIVPGPTSVLWDFLSSSKLIRGQLLCVWETSPTIDELLLFFIFLIRRFNHGSSSCSLLPLPKEQAVH